MSDVLSVAISFLGQEVWLSPGRAHSLIGKSGDLSSLSALLLTLCVALVDASPLGLSFPIYVKKQMDQLLVGDLPAQSLRFLWVLVQAHESCRSAVGD